MNNVFGENMAYPSIFKAYLMEAINASDFKDNIVYKDLDNLSLGIMKMNVNMFNLNRMFKTIFRSYKRAKFGILDLKTLHYKNNYQLYSMKVVITYRTSKWIMSITISDEYEEGLYKQNRYINDLKKSMDLYMYDKYDLYVDAYYRIVNNIHNNFISLYNFYKNYIKFKDKRLFISKLYCLYLKREKDINLDYVEKNISRLYNQTIIRKWKSYAYLNDYYLEYEEIIKVLREVNNLLKERID